MALSVALSSENRPAADVKFTLCKRPFSKRLACASAASACASNIKLTSPTFHLSALASSLFAMLNGSVVVPMLSMSISLSSTLQKKNRVDKSHHDRAIRPYTAIDKSTVALNGGRGKIGWSRRGRERNVNGRRINIIHEPAVMRCLENVNPAGDAR